MVKIGLISTGDELLRGIILDRNATWMASKLDEHGYAVEQITTVGDNLESLTKTLKTAFEAFDLVVVGGGLGPTDDDLTAEAAAKAADCPLTMNDEAVSQIEATFERFGFPMSKINLKQANLPRTCTVLENKSGTAPGFSLKTQKGKAVFLPGPPVELKPMFEAYVLGELPKPKETRHRMVFKCFGAGESNFQVKVKPVTELYPNTRLSFRAAFPELGITLIAPDEETLENAGSELRNLLGKSVYATEEIGLPEVLGKTLRERGLTIGTAESCTGGLIGHLLTEVPGSSDYYLGSLVAYDNSIKIGVLGMDRALLDAHGAVSEPVARAMAESARQALGADIGLATSGIAGPGGGTPEKPIGLVHMAVATLGGITYKKLEFPNFGRSQIKRASAWYVMRMALNAITEDQ